MTSPSTPAALASATPAMRQYLDTKRHHRDAIVLFRMGDFYEMFYEDAVTAARVLELTLTSRAKDSAGAEIPMCGVPFHALDTYLGRLIRKGYRAAICEQVEDPKQAKGVVKREVTRIVSPGTFTDASYLDAREPAFLAALSPASSAGDTVGLAFLDVSTGEFAATEFRGPSAAPGMAATELAMLHVRAKCCCLTSSTRRPLVFTSSAPRITRVDAWTFESGRARETLLAQLQAQSLSGYGLEQAPAAVSAAGAIVDYLKTTQRTELTHIRDIAWRSARGCLADRSGHAAPSPIWSMASMAAARVRCSTNSTGP